MSFNSPEMEDKLALRKARDVIKVATVVQPPFMQWNEAEGINITHQELFGADQCFRDL